jgi:hypothetical protein
VLLAEKRPALASLRTGIAVFALPLSVLSVLIATVGFHAHLLSNLIDSAQTRLKNRVDSRSRLHLTISDPPKDGFAAANLRPLLAAP